MTIVNTSNVHDLSAAGGGLKIGNSSTELIGFHGVDPTDQSAFVTNTSGTLGNTNTQLTAVIAVLVCKGLMAAS